MLSIPSVHGFLTLGQNGMSFSGTGDTSIGKDKMDFVKVFVSSFFFIVNALEKKPMLLFNTAAYHAAVGSEAAMR